MPKKKYSLIILLLILPIVLIFLSLYFKSAKGEYYIFRYFDPSYAYLINSLNLAQLNGSSVGHIDHPGTTVQTIGAIIVKLVHTFKFSNEDLVLSVLKNPEYFLNIINLIFVLMIAVSLFILGYVIYRIFGNIYAAFIFQLSPFFTTSKYYALTNVSSEPLLIFTCLLFIALTMSYVNENDLTKSKNLKYIFGFGVLCGFGVVTKILFFPLLAIPFFLIKKIRNKILFVAITIIAFLIFVCPAISYDNSVRFFVWIKDLVLHSGEYGYGEENIINQSKFLNNFKKILIYEPSFSLPYLLTGIILFLQIFKRYRKTIQDNKYFTLMIALFITMTIQLLIVSKQFAIYYMLPVMMLSVTSLFVVNSFAKETFPGFYKSKNYLYLSLALVLLLLFSARSDYNQLAAYKFSRDECKKTMDFIKNNFHDLPVVSSYKTSSPENALYYGASYSGFVQSKYDQTLQTLYPDYFFFYPKTNEFKYADISYVSEKLKKYDRLVFQCMDENGITGFTEALKKITGKQDIEYKNVCTNNAGERIYEVTLYNNIR